MSEQYSKKVMDHFLHPRNMGTIKNPDGYGKIGNPVCGDLMEVYITVSNNIITDIKFQTFGCVAAIATSSMMTELVKGMNLDDALQLTKDMIAEHLDGLPLQKLHCSNLAAEALHEAIRAYKKKKRQK